MSQSARFWPRFHWGLHESDAARRSLGLEVSLSCASACCADREIGDRLWPAPLGTASPIPRSAQ